MTEEEMIERKITRQEAEEKIKQTIAEHFGVDVEEISEKTVFINDLNADSLDLVELVMELEDQFEMHISDVEAEEIQTVGAAIKHICLKLDIN